MDIDNSIFIKSLIEKVLLSQKDKSVKEFLKFCEENNILDDVYTYDFMLTCVEYELNNFLIHLIKESKYKDFLFKKTYHEMLNEIKNNYRCNINKDEKTFSQYIYGDLDDGSINSLLLSKKGFDFIKKYKTSEERLKEYKNIIAFERFEKLFLYLIEKNNFTGMNKILLDGRFYINKSNIYMILEYINKNDNKNNLIIKLLTSNYVSNKIKNLIFEYKCQDKDSKTFKDLTSEKIFNKNNLKINKTNIFKWIIKSVSYDNIKMFTFLYNKIQLTDLDYKNIFNCISVYDSKDCLEFIYKQNELKVSSIKNELLLDSCIYVSEYVIKFLFEKYDYSNFTEKILKNAQKSSSFSKVIGYICKYSNLDIFIEDYKYIKNNIKNIKNDDITKLFTHREIPINKFDYLFLKMCLSFKDDKMFNAIVDNKGFDYTDIKTLEFIIRSKECDYLKYVHTKYSNLKLNNIELINALAIYNNTEMFSYAINNNLIDIKKHSDTLIKFTIEEKNINLLIDIIKHEDSIISDNSFSKINVVKDNISENYVREINKAIRTKKIISIF
jgi:hypothetical protein